MKVGDSDFTPQMLRAKNAEADTILTFANTVEVANALKAANKMGSKPKVISAWALANSTFPSCERSIGRRDGDADIHFRREQAAAGGGAL
jgi:ABC-type branched-subunit amino acid transport system substrate-binding protein